MKASSPTGPTSEPLDDAQTIATRVAWIAGDRLTEGCSSAESVALAITVTVAMAALHVGYADPPPDHFVLNSLADVKGNGRAAVRAIAEGYLDDMREGAAYHGEVDDLGALEFFEAEQARARRVLAALDTEAGS